MMPVSKRFTPVEMHGGCLIKRDDLWDECGVANGGKSRTAGIICREIIRRGGRGVAACLDRNSSIPGMLARVCRYYGVDLHLHIPQANKPLTGVFIEAVGNGAKLFDHYPGYMSVRRKRLRDSLKDNPGVFEVGLGLSVNWEGNPTIEATAAQTANLPNGIGRVVIPLGSGQMFAGVLLGLSRLRDAVRPRLLGVEVGEGNKPDNLPPWAEVIHAKTDFKKYITGALGGLSLDPAYEAKCIDFLQPGDLLWVVAHRDTE